MIQIHFRLIYNPEKKLFELTFGQTGQDKVNKAWELTSKETELLVKNARNQLIDTTDAMTEFMLNTGDYKVVLKGVKSKPAFQAIVEYLEKVWNSFRGSSYDEIHS